ncbi:two-component system histidine kinase PnpS [Paenibacillus sp. IHBB 10380]|uniref:two-component system histidine kinase PnpS n=1 Tax=Paenibacillus sp. IHBB 10380 TaxID=1566358 RepID=UPI0005CFB423|nr:ATP-binding protein [Paenibacillus sp. IHBB 10380]AJS59579.1 histidine kinase [Paenibacillus sp. IHBB 10380]
MRPFRSRLTLILMIMIGVTILGAGIVMAKVFKDSHIEVLEDNMYREIMLLSSTFDFHSIVGEEAELYYSTEAKEISELTNARVTFIDHDGDVIGDSESDADEMDNHRGREEIQSADENNIGYAIRYSATLGQDMLYVAAPVKSGDVYDGYIRLSVSLKFVDEGMRRAWTLVAVWFIVLFAVAAIVSYRVAGSLTSPLEKITKVARRFSHLDYTARVKIERHDEVGQLSHAINTMADSLQTQLKIIQDNEDLLQSVLDNMAGGIVMIDDKDNIAMVNPFAEKTLGIKSSQLLGKSYLEMKQHYELTKILKEGLYHRKPIHEERTLYNPDEKIVRLDGVPMNAEGGPYKGMLFLFQDVTDIRRLENMRSEFVANVSHELKTPVAAVKGFSETLLAGGVKDEKTVRSFLQIIYDESERLNRLIGDILELSKIESKRIPLSLSPVHLSSFVASMLETMETVAQKKRISLQAEVPEELYMEADEDKLRQILMNLLANAINYTQDGGRVRVVVDHHELSKEEETISFTVTDTGMGIPKKDLPRIFERFYRVDKARSRISGGTGLGLSIVKHLVDLHHGTLSVESELNIGSSFRVELPMLQDSE